MTGVNERADETQIKQEPSSLFYFCLFLVYALGFPSIIIAM